MDMKRIWSAVLIFGELFFLFLIWPMIDVLSPFITGEREILNPMTNSQISAVLCLAIISGSLIWASYTLRMVRRCSKE